MNNENNTNSNSGFNGEVLGNLNSSTNFNNVSQQQPNMQPQVMAQPETLETLDTNSSIVMDTPVQNNLNMNNGGVIGQTNLNEVPPLQNMTQPEVPPVQTPEPAYTNPQNINPMPGFENSSTIGTTPPVSLEPEKKPHKKQPNKTLFVVIIIVVLFGIGFGVYYVLQYTDLLNKAPKVVITPKDIEINMGDKLSTTISDYATVTGTDIKNCNLNINEIDSTNPGEYKFTVTCGEMYKTGKVTVVDNRELEVNTKKVYKVKGDTVEPKDFIEKTIAGYTYEFVDPTSVQNYLNSDNGTYTIKIKVTSGTKIKEVDAELIVQQYSIRGYITCSSKEQTVPSDSATMTVQEKFALLNDGNNGFGGITTEIHSFKFTDETKYADYLAKYNSTGSITINNITGNTNFDNDSLTITISKERTKEEVIGQYGDSNLINYKSIKTYFESTLGYTCKYDENKND